jgi:hypothetical protein
MAVFLLSLSAVPDAVGSEAAERVSSEAKALVDAYERQEELLVAATREWGADGAERRKLRESMATLQKNFELAKLNLTSALEALEAAAARVPESGVLEKPGRIEAAVSEVGERLRARWQREHLAREREREQREREAAERARGMK